eukprot:5260966-Alexandrium_andersonii.AAC.1
MKASLARTRATGMAISQHRKHNHAPRQQRRGRNGKGKSKAKGEAAQAAAAAAASAEDGGQAGEDPDVDDEKGESEPESIDPGAELLVLKPQMVLSVDLFVAVWLA